MRGRHRHRLVLAACLTALAAAIGVFVFGLGRSEAPVDARFQGKPLRVDGLELPARVEGTKVQLATPDGFQTRFWPGINLGSTVPGHQPGEVAARAQDYRRWFPQMSDLGVRVIRVYTLLDPSFYSELDAYNREHSLAPLYVIQGVSIPEDELAASGDLYDPTVMREQRRFTTEIHAAVSGHLTIPNRLGEASGTWTVDAQRWVIGWSFGIELDPSALALSEAANPPRGYRGRYISTTGASTSTEAWLARQLDFLSSLDEREGWSRPITFTNWLPLDPIHHAYEPLPREDMVSVDAMHLKAMSAWPGGFFASYHAYPYYPDFLRDTPAYADSADPYAAYLAELKAHHHGQAVMITEFGVPSSLGAAHLGLRGRDQGNHDEAESLQMDADMMGLIEKGGYAGGVLFEWADEWFKQTWNTLEAELPADRRQMWRNALTNEEHFGVLSSEAKLEGPVNIDGDLAEWQHDVPSQGLWESDHGVLAMRAAHDEAYLYLTLHFEDKKILEGGVTLGLDVRPGENRGLPGVPGLRMPGADTSLHITFSRIQVERAAWSDELVNEYGLGFHYVPGVRAADVQEGSGVWNPQRLILNRPLTVPASGEQKPVELLDLGDLPLKSEGDDSRTIGAANDGNVELRIPWAMLGLADPSSRQLISPHPDGTISTEPLAPQRGIGMEVYNAAGTQLATATPDYNWKPWRQVEFSERQKRGWSTLADAFTEASGRSPGTRWDWRPSTLVALSLAAGLILLGGAIVFVTRRRRGRREHISRARRKRMREALLSSDEPALAEAALEAVRVPAAQADFGWVLHDSYPLIDTPAQQALIAAIARTPLPGDLLSTLHSRRPLRRGQARSLLVQLHVAESEQLLVALLSDSNPSIRLETCLWLGDRAGNASDAGVRALLTALIRGYLPDQPLVAALSNRWAIAVLAATLAASEPTGDSVPTRAGNPGWRAAAKRALEAAEADAAAPVASLDEEQFRA